MFPDLQVLGEKPELPDTHSEDEKMDASNRKVAKLYQVTFVQVYDDTLIGSGVSHLVDDSSNQPHICEVETGSVHLSVCIPGVQRRWWHKG